jgi:hypothetical protein
LAGSNEEENIRNLLKARGGKANGFGFQNSMKKKISLISDSEGTDSKSNIDLDHDGAGLAFDT